MPSARFSGTWIFVPGFKIGFQSGAVGSNVYANKPKKGAQPTVATVHKDTDRFIGRCGLLPWTIDLRPEVEVAYLLARAYWGQGLATEAATALVRYGFEELHLSRLICLIDRENRASIRVASKIGMTFEKEGRDEKGPYLLYSRER